jgi:hypothetical protein
MPPLHDPRRPWENRLLVRMNEMIKRRAWPRVIFWTIIGLVAGLLATGKRGVHLADWREATLIGGLCGLAWGILCEVRRRRQ